MARNNNMIAKLRLTCSLLQIPSVSLDSDHRLVVMQTRHTFKKRKPAENKKRVSLHNRGGPRCWKTLEISENSYKQHHFENTVRFKWTPVSIKNQTSWWNEELKLKVKYKQRCFRLWTKSRTPESREAYTTARREAHTFKRQSKKDAWNTIREEMEWHVIGTKKLIYQQETSDRNVQHRNAHSHYIKIKDSDGIIIEL